MSGYKRKKNMRTTAIETLKITSDAFRFNEHIPSVYTCEGKNINPPLTIDNIPDNTETLAIIMDDPDAPNGTFNHWVVWNIPPKPMIGENTLTGGVEGLNDYEKHNYMGPCPPKDTHRYFFKIYALDRTLHLEPNSKREALEIAMHGHIIAYGELIGLYKKKKI